MRNKVCSQSPVELNTCPAPVRARPSFFPFDVEASMLCRFVGCYQHGGPGFKFADGGISSTTREKQTRRALALEDKATRCDANDMVHRRPDTKTKSGFWAMIYPKRSFKAIRRL